MESALAHQPMSLFFNPTGELRSGFRVLLFYFFSLLWLIAVQTLIRSVGWSSRAVYLAVLYPLDALGIFGISVFSFRKLDHCSSAALGIKNKRGGRLFLTGTLAGIVSVSLVFIGVWREVGFQGPIHLRSEVLLSRTFFLGVAMFFFAAALEELGFRGYPFIALRPSLRRWGASAFLSLLFVAVHPNLYHFPAGVISIFLGGIFFTQLFVLAESLWLPIGLHFGWNLAQDWIFPLSDRNRTVLEVTTFDPAALGLTMGAEQSWWAVVVLGALVVLVEAFMQKKAVLSNES